MKKEKQVCDFGKNDYNHIKRTDVEKAPRPGGGQGKGKPPKGDVTAPTISSISVSNNTDVSVTVHWTTSEETSCVIQYGLTTIYGTSKTSIGPLTHSVVLSGLTPATTYNFKIVATDYAGNVTSSSNSTFFTSAQATKVLYLEFYGRTVSGTSWSVSSIVAAHSGLTESEIAQVITIVQGHYDPYSVVVTDDVNLYNNTPTDRKQMIVFTESNEWYGNNAGGVAYINSFGWADQSPAWVFTKLLNYNAHNIGEAGAHEGGHTVGCRHQVTCNNDVITSSYNAGDGVHAPVMGVSYYVAAGEWWVGPCSLGCSVIQDDNSLIVAKLGLK